MVLRVAVPDVLKLEVAIEPDEPAGEPEEEFCEGGVHVEVVFAQDVVRGKFTKVDFVEAA